MRYTILGDKNPKKVKKKKKEIIKVNATAGNSEVIAEPAAIKKIKKQK